ncbi:16S rRNA (cytidine(1402)-2'-O)-methyltransferase [Saprospiraceae bacterium]|nr:16S rRNA (cytidine(1402)-2'-O)-methyltransferase [Saprospiraceae bacterium]
MLYIVPTPVGNLGDMTARAIKVLEEVDTILAEDTRTSGKLLKHFGITTRSQSFHSHNEHKALESVIDRLKSGENMALISDAGTPAISDPGFLLSSACHDNDIPISCLPGATAVIPALVSSGIACGRFYFEGFLPHKKGRQTRLKFLANFPETFVLYESPHRLVKCLEQLKEYCGVDRIACVCREISKVYEEVKRGTTEELIEHFSLKNVKGEIVIVVTGYKEIKEKKRKYEKD